MHIPNWFIQFYIPTISTVITNAVTWIPPAAIATRNRRSINSHNQGEKAIDTPTINCITAAAISGLRRPNLQSYYIQVWQNIVTVIEILHVPVR